MGDSSQLKTSMLSSASSSITWQVSTPAHHSSNSQLSQQLKQLNRDVDSTLEFVCGVSNILCASTPTNICLAVLGFLALIGVGLGVRYLSDCPAQPRIPVFLFVGGCFGLLKIVHVMWANFKRPSYSNFSSETASYGPQSSVRIIDGILNVFLVIWLILGAFWTLSIWCPYWEPPLHEPNNWCEPAVYFSALALLCLAVSISICRAVCHIALAVCYKCSNIFQD